MSTVVLFSVYMWIALFSAETTSSTFDLCGINEITGENFTLSLNFSTENANKTGNECSRTIILKSKRIKLFVEEAKFASGVVFEIQDGPFMNQGMKLWPKPGGDIRSTFLSSSNAIFIRFKDVSGGGNGASSFQGRISSVPYQDKCHCRGVKNGKMECSESEAERRCEVKCNDSYMELSMNQDMICNLAREEWDIDVNRVPLSCQKIQPPLNIKATVNINYTNNTCEQLDVGKIANVFQAFLLKNNTIGSKGMCFRAGGEDKIQCNHTRLRVNCTTMNTSSSTQVTIIDQILEPATLIEASKKFQDLFAAYNNLNFKELLASKELAPGSGNISTMIIANDSLVSMVSPWCGVDNDFIRLAANQSFFVCSTCPTNHFYNITAHVCEKCPPGTFASSRARSCSQQNSTLLIPLKFSCDNKCMKGKHVDGKSWMCEWCPMDTYQNSSTKVNPDCTPCPGEKKTRFPGAQDVTECRDPCPNGTYLNISSGTCFKCPVGSYMDVHSHVFERCKSCGRKKITQATGSKTISDCYECMKGSFYNSSSKSCSLCPEGKYQDEVNQDTCKDCDRGKTTLDHGTNTSSDCVVVCGLGQYLNDSDKACLDCPFNTYMDNAKHRSKECKACGPNQITNATGTSNISQCFSCRKGTFLNKTVSQCQRCPKGTFQDQPGRDTCKDCDRGKTTLDYGTNTSSDCVVVCGLGQYLNDSDEACLDCPFNTYMDNAKHRSKECKACGPNQITYATGTSNISQCFSCRKGTFLNKTVSQCQRCPKGTFQDQPSRDTCKDCDRGKTTLDYGTNTSSDCVVVCGLGQYLNDSDEACLDCPFNTYMDSAKHRSKECKACGPNQITNATGTSNISQCFSCRKGTFLNKTVSQCQRCPKGTFQDQPGQDKCTQCPDTMSTDNSGQWNKSACVAICGKGEFYDSSDNRCKPCSYGTYQESENHQSTSCKVCPRQGAVDFKQCAKFELVKMSLRFTSLSWTDELENTSNAFYQKKKISIEKAIRFELRKDPSFQSVIVTGMMRGSIIADFDLFFNEKVGYFPAEALQTAALGGRVGNLSVAPDSLKILHQDCAQPLGMENRKVTNDQITALNYLKNYEPYEGRLNINGGRGWKAEYTRAMKEYLQIDFKIKVNITGVATQGQSTSNLFVKQYKLNTSEDGNKWIEYTENGTSQVRTID